MEEYNKPEEFLISKVIYIDEVCRLCHWSVRIVINHSKKGKFSISSFRSNFAQEALSKVSESQIKYDSLLYQSGQLVFSRSDAILHILKDMGGKWKILYVFIVIPKAIRDRVYEMVARNRYSWFGKMNYCKLP